MHLYTVKMHKMYVTVALSNSLYAIVVSLCCQIVCCCFYVAVNRKQYFLILLFIYFIHKSGILAFDWLGLALTLTLNLTLTINSRKQLGLIETQAKGEPF